MLKPAGSLCNMKCDYCYYLEKADLLSQGDKTGKTFMSDQILEKFIASYITSQPPGNVSFTWHGGEALIRPLSFYKKALVFQKKYAGNLYSIDNSIQTNGLLLNEEWCRFFKENNFLVGISLDGSERQHDKFRRTNGGNNSFSRVARGINLLQHHGVDFNVLATVNSYNADEPLEFYHAIKALGVEYIQFTPIIERVGSCTNSFAEPEDLSILTRSQDSPVDTPNSITSSPMVPYSITPLQWGYFTTTIFDEWIKDDVGRIFIQLFDVTLANWMGMSPGLCSMAKYCGRAGVMEWNGDVFSCDHFVYPRYKLGNIMDKSLEEMMNSEEQIRFGNLKYDALPTQCIECEFLFACHGECPKNRFSHTADGTPGLNYLCRGYYKFFKHVAPYMDFMKQCLMDGKPPALVMDWIKDFK